MCRIIPKKKITEDVRKLIMRIPYYILIISLLYGCSLAAPGIVEEEYINQGLSEMQQRYLQWLDKKGISEQSIVGLSEKEVKNKIGRPSHIFYAKNWSYCQSLIKKEEILPDKCHGESWIYTNWFGIPFMSSFSQYSVKFRDGVVKEIEGPLSSLTPIEIENLPDQSSLF